MKIYYPTKTGRGKYTPLYGRGRDIHCMKRGGYVPLLLSPGLGASNGGSGILTKKKIEDSKPQMNNVIRKLEKLQMQPKKKNITFQI